MRVALNSPVLEVICGSAGFYRFNNPGASVAVERFTRISTFARFKDVCY